MTTDDELGNNSGGDMVEQINPIISATQSSDAIQVRL